MEKTEITSRDDVHRLVSEFYAKIRVHDTLGPIFNGLITDWPKHLELLTDFWESQLFLKKRTYNGNPVKAHIKVDEWMGNALTPEHFGQWLNLWFATLDEHYEGAQVWVAKNRAQKMSTMLFLEVFKARGS